MRYDETPQQTEDNREQFLADAFNARTLLDMEASLDKACRLLPAEQHTHHNRTLVANEIIAGMRRGRSDRDGMVKDALAAVAGLSTAKRSKGPAARRSGGRS
jgi:hypothetical protein